MRELATEALRIFAEQRMERETQAALDLLEAAARRDALTREVLEQTIRASKATRASGRLRSTRRDTGPPSG